MKIFSSLILFGVFAMGLNSCQSSATHTQLILEIDSTIVQLEKTRHILSEMEEAKATEMKIEYESLNNKVMGHFSPEDTSKFWRNEIADLQFCSMSLSRYINEEKHIQKEIDFTINQLKTFKEDLENDLIPQGKIEEYSNIELQSAAIILQKSSKRGGRALHCYTNFDVIIAKADSIYESINTSL